MEFFRILDFMYIMCMIDTWVLATSTAFGRLNDRMWNVKPITLKMKLNVYRAVVLSALLFGLEVSTLYARHVQRLSVLVQRHLRGLMGISWKDHISNVEVLRQAGGIHQSNTLFIERCESAFRQHFTETIVCSGQVIECAS